MAWNNETWKTGDGSNETIDLRYQPFWDVRDNADGRGGNDTIYGNIADNTLQGGDGNDRMYGGSGWDTLQGEADNDRLFGEADDDQLLGGTGADTLWGGDGNDSMLGEDGNDSLLGENGRDTLAGQSGANTLDGGDGNDRLLGGDGYDVFTDVFGSDFMVGGPGPSSEAGINRVDYSDYYGRIVVDLANQRGLQEAAVYHVDQGYVFNSEGVDTLISISDVVGTRFNDAITGSLGDNHLFGGDGYDTLSGGGGNDTLEAGANQDRMTGGTGNDWFVLNSAIDGSQDNLDRITDFRSGQDTIVLDNAVFTGIPTLRDGALSAAAFRVVETPEPTGLDTGDRLIYSTWNGWLFYDPDGSGAQLATPIARFDAMPAGPLVASDFLVV